MLERVGDEPDERTVQLALDALEAGITAAQPDTVLDESLSLDGNLLQVNAESYDLSTYDDVIVLGGGNGAGRIASYLDDLLHEELTAGVIVTDDPVPTSGIEMIEASHPIPTDVNLSGTTKLLTQARQSDEDTLVLVAITGGGSALLSAPADGVSLSELQTVTDELLQSGIPIERINTVRKHISKLKGGRLARELAPADTIGLIFSDVSSDDPSVVASGPLSPDSSTFEDAMAVLSAANINVPVAVEQHLKAGIRGETRETPDDGESIFDTVSTHILADNFTAASAARDVCEQAGFNSVLLSTSIRGEAREAAKTYIAIGEEARRTGHPIEPPAAIVSGGETTVRITGDGTGGPNQEFALSGAIELANDCVLGSVDTDGIDGPTDAAGALVTGETVTDREAARTALADNAAYTFLAEKDALLISGQTGTNVNDLRVLLVP